MQRFRRNSWDGHDDHWSFGCLGTSTARPRAFWTSGPDRWLLALSDACPGSFVQESNFQNCLGSSVKQIFKTM